MHSFKDTEGREWHVKITLGIARDLKDQTEIDLLDGKALLTAAADPYVMGQVLWVVCQKQATSRNLSPEDFAAAFDGDVVTEATDALVEASIDFFPKARRPAIQKAFEKMKAMEQAGMERVLVELDDPELESRILGQFGSTSGGSPG